MLLSIIVPVYNVETYLSQCITSILNQNMDDYEIILINDGSTDGSGKICDKFANRYENIHAIHQENRGLAGARNSGIRLAAGNYLMFIDSDDFINEHININAMIHSLNADIIQYKWVYYFDRTGQYRYFEDFPLFTNEPYAQILASEVQQGILSVSACNKIVDRQLILENDIFFDESLLSEDIDWSLKLYLHARSIQIVNDDVYIYRQQRPGSITTTASPQSIKSLFSIIKKWYRYNYPNQKIRDIYLNYLAYQYVILLTTNNRHNCDAELRKEIYGLKDILNYSENFKVRMANKVFHILGMKPGIYVLKLYWELRKRNVIKI